MATDSTIEWFQQGLGTRVDALEVAQQAIRDGDKQGSNTARQLANSLFGQAERYGFPEIRDAAYRVAHCSDHDLEESAVELIAALRREAAKATQAKNVVLVIGGDSEFNQTLVQKIQTAEREVLCASTAAQAYAHIKEQKVVFIVLNLLLPDADGRSVLVHIREDPVSASTPVLILTERCSDGLSEFCDLVMNGDDCMDGPHDPGIVAARVRARLRRSHETVQSAHRDPLTGLLNRAALREQFASVLAASGKTGEPVAFAIISIDHARNILNKHGVLASEEVVQTVASALSKSFRATDGLARWGVHEFAAFFPDQDQFGGTRAVEKVAEVMRERHFTAPDGSDFQVTLSAGVTPVVEGYSIDAAISEAERYLYKAQTAGGARVVSSQTRIVQRTERVLVLVNDAVTSRVLNHLFEREGFEVTHTSNAERGISAAASEKRFHLLVVEAQLPDRDGFEVVSIIRHMPRNNRVPIIMLIERNEPQNIVKALEHGANNYVLTPFAPSSFMTHVRRLLTRGLVDTDLCSTMLKRVLVCDDERKSLILAASALHQRGGFEVYLGLGAVDACARFKEVRPDTLVVCADLAEKDGNSLETLLAMAESASTNVVLAAAPDSAQARDLEDRIKGTVPYPFSALELGEQLESAIGAVFNANRAPDSSQHLNSEVQRVVALGRAK